MGIRTTSVQVPGILESTAQPDPSPCTEPQSGAPGPACCLPRAAASSPRRLCPHPHPRPAPAFPPLPSAGRRRTLGDVIDALGALLSPPGGWA